MSHIIHMYRPFLNGCSFDVMTHIWLKIKRRVSFGFGFDSPNKYYKGLDSEIITFLLFLNDMDGPDGKVPAQHTSCNSFACQAECQKHLIPCDSILFIHQNPTPRT